MYTQIEKLILLYVNMLVQILIICNVKFDVFPSNSTSSILTVFKENDIILKTYLFIFCTVLFQVDKKTYNLVVYQQEIFEVLVV